MKFLNKFFHRFDFVILNLIFLAFVLTLFKITVLDVIPQSFDKG